LKRIPRELQSNRILGIVTLTEVGGPGLVGKIGSMKQPPDPHYRYRFPAAIINHAVWLYHVFSLSQLLDP
jgi:hypothetical protein